MRNIFLFLRRYFTFIAFVLLQLLALWMLFNYNRYHHTVFLGVASEVTGRINTQKARIDEYVHQGDENKRVHRTNDSLLNLLRSNFDSRDTAQRLVIDSVKLDSTYTQRRYYWRSAQVVYNTINAEQNYLQLNRGSNQGLKDNMAVISSNLGVVGVVVNVSPNFSQVMSLLHVQSSVSAAHRRSGTLGTVEWDAKDPRFVTLKNMPRSVEVKVGDTINTSRYSYNFPPGYAIGTVVQVSSDPATGFYILKVKTTVDFNTVGQVFVVENLQRTEQTQLFKDSEIKMEQQRRTTR